MILAGSCQWTTSAQEVRLATPLLRQTATTNAVGIEIKQ